MRNRLTLILALSLAPFAFGQAARYDMPILPTTPAQTQGGSQPAVLAVINATVSVCGFPAVMSGGMCTNTITTYTDSTLGVSCPSTAQLTAPGSPVCLSTTGLQGGFGFWYNIQQQTHMTYTVRTKWGTFGPYDIAQSVSGAAGNPGGANLQLQFNHGGIFDGSSLFSYNTNFGPSMQKPRSDPTNPNYGLASGCANSADPSGSLDSTCAFNAAIAFITTSYGTKTTGPFEQWRLPAGHFKISGAIRIPLTFIVQGDKRSPTIIEQTNPSANFFTVFNDGSATPNINGFGMHGGIYDLTLMCGVSLSGTPGQPFNGCTGTQIEIGANVQGFEVSGVGFMNTGGRGLSMSGTAEEMHINNLWFYGVRWPIINVGQSTDPVRDITMSAVGVTTGQYYFSSNSVLGQIAAESSQTYNPTTIFLTSLTLDGFGGMQFTVNCTTAPACLQKGINNTSSPIAPGMWFKIAGVTAGGFTAANGVYQATAVTGTSGNPFTISSCPPGDVSAICTVAPPAQAQQGGTWTNWSVNYGPDEKVQFTCTTSAGCTPTLQTPAAGTTASLAGSWWGPSVFPDMQSSIYAPSTANKFEVLRDSPNWNQALIQFPQGGATKLDTVYCEGFILHGEPHLNPCVRLGGYLPWTNLTSSLAGAATCSSVAPCIVPVFDTSWFPNYVNDPQDVALNGFTSANFTVIMPQDYNATQTGVASAFVAGVNTNQYEVVADVMSGPTSAYITTRNAAGSTAPPGTTWPAGSKIGFNRGFSPVAGSGNNTLEISNFHTNVIQPDKGNWDSECSWQGPNYCADIDIGVGYDNTTFWPAGWTGSYAPNMGVTIEDVFGNKCGFDSSILLGEHCALVHGSANVVFRQSTLITGSTMEVPPAAQNGTYIGMSGQGVIAAQYTANGTPQVANVSVQDDNTHMVGFSSPNAPNTPGAYFGKADIIKGGGSGFGFSTSSPANTVVGEQVTGQWWRFDQGSNNKTASITSWAISGSTATFQATNTFQLGQDCVTITGLAAGAFMNNINANGTCYMVTTPISGSQFSISTLVSVNGIAAHGYNATSATESGTATGYHSGFVEFFNGGPTFTGTNICGGWKEWNSGPANWVYTPFQVCMGSTPGSTGSVTTPTGTPVTFNDALTVIGATTLPAATTIGGASFTPFTYNFATDTGSANNYAIALNPALTTYIAGMPIRFKPANANTGASVLNINSLGNKAIVKCGNVALVAGDIPVGNNFIANLIYDTTAGFQLQNPQAVGCTGALASGTFTLPTSAIASGVCSAAVTVGATGVLTTDVVSTSFNGDPTAITGYAPTTGGTLYIYAYPTANNVNVKVCNNTSASITPGAATLNFKVTR